MNKKNVILIIVLICIIIAIAILMFIILNNKESSNNISNYGVVSVDDTILAKYVKGKKTLLLFFASWCPECIAEANDINEYILSNTDKNVIVISHDENIENIRKYVTENGYNKWFVVFDPERSIRNIIDPGKRGIPSSYVLDENMEVIGFHKGKLDTKGLEELYNNPVISIEE